MTKTLRIIDGEPVWFNKGELFAEAKATREVRSAHYGCTLHQVNELREDAKKHGLAVEFKPDPHLVENGKALWYDACFSSEGERNRYAARFNERDLSSRAGDAISAVELSEAEQRAKAMFAHLETK